LTAGRLVGDEDLRAARLLDAQAKAAELFAAIGPADIIAPGVRETEASDAIRDLAAEMFGSAGTGTSGSSGLAPTPCSRTGTTRRTG